MSSLRYVSALVVVVWGSLILTGCGDDASSPSPPQRATGPPPGFGGARENQDLAVPANIVTDDLIARARRDTPQRTLLEWWQAIQFRDVAMARRLITPSALASVGRSRFRRMVLLVGDGLPGIRILRTRVSGPEAAVRFFLEFAPGQDGSSTLVPRSIGLRHVDRGWLVDDVEYLIASARNAER